MQRTSSPRTAAALIGLLLLLTLSPAAAGESPVSGRITAAGEGRLIRVELSIGTPAPAPVIVTLMLPAGVTVETAQPALNRFDSRSGEAKWLLNGLGRGRYTIELQPSRPVGIKELQGQLRYKHPVSGLTVAEEIR